VIRAFRTNLQRGHSDCTHENFKDVVRPANSFDAFLRNIFETRTALETRPSNAPQRPFTSSSLTRRP
jgi:hypothetical protein